MVEEAVQHEESKPIAVLEIGFEQPGRAAPNRGGDLFSGSHVQYVGIDLHEVISEISDFSKFRTGPNVKVAFTAMDAGAMQFPDDSFDYVLMRSIFGQYRMHPQFWKSSPENAGSGLFEAFRVLKPGGKIIIAEENTPEDIDIVEARIREAGFQPLDFAFLNVQYDELEPSDKWNELRRPFFADKPLLPGPTLMQGSPYILIAQKDPNPEYQTFEESITPKASNEPEKITVVYKIGKNKPKSILRKKRI